jgi:peptidoglycan hydrolase-like protein with peptidoglycan-binding domain
MRVPAILILALLLAAPAAAAGKPEVAALQVGLRARGFYDGTVDGVRGPATAHAVRDLQRVAGLAVDGIAGPQTRRALGKLGRPALGARPLSTGRVGWDVAALQFLLSWHGFPSGQFDGRFGARVETAVRRYQSWAGLAADGVAGPATIAHLRSAPLPRSPLRLSWPLALPVGDTFGPRGDRFHAGIDIPAASGTPVGAARTGTVVFAGWDAGGFGNLVVIAHGRGVETFYAHLSQIAVEEGEPVTAGARIGRVGSTGHSTGPHLHFEVRVRSASVDPLGALP